MEFLTCNWNWYLKHLKNTIWWHRFTNCKALRKILPTSNIIYCDTFQHASLLESRSCMPCRATHLSLYSQELCPHNATLTYAKHIWKNTHNSTSLHTWCSVCVEYANQTATCKRKTADFGKIWHTSEWTKWLILFIPRYVSELLHPCGDIYIKNKKNQHCSSFYTNRWSV